MVTSSLDDEGHDYALEKLRAQNHNRHLSYEVIHLPAEGCTHPPTIRYEAKTHPSDSTPGSVCAMVTTAMFRKGRVVFLDFLAIAEVTVGIDNRSELPT
mmetsp:Transcript_3128/g.4633  ORF Transcript_3128/g.4633 Transcript_3128/m.4633 type:complete len:99 (-) Transcript_3128:514-810(-)